MHLNVSRVTLPKWEISRDHRTNTRKVTELSHASFHNRETSLQLGVRISHISIYLEYGTVLVGYIAKSGRKTTIFCPRKRIF